MDAEVRKESAPDFKDRKTGLVLFGILQLVAGCGCLLLLGFAGIGIAITSASEIASELQVNATAMIPGLGIYLVAAILFIWLGIGSIMARRWARALILLLSWFGLLAGLCALVGAAFFMPDMDTGMAEIDGQSQMAATIGYLFVFVFLFLLFILVPALQVLFYGSKNVKATCEARDSKIRWTDKRPLPVLALTLMLVYGAASMLLMGFYNWVAPFFGMILSGSAGAIVILFNMSALGLLAWHIYGLSIRAWWGVVLFYLAWVISAVITFSRVPILEFYEKMNMLDEQSMLVLGSTMSNSNLLLMSVAAMVPYFAFLLYTKRFFKAIPEMTTPVPGDGI